MRQFYKLFLSIAILFILSGCSVPALMFTGASGTGAVLSQQKTVGDTVDDFNIWTKIKASFLSNHKEIPGVLSNVSVEVSEGRVLFTGGVHSADDRLKVLRIGWDQSGVREVINEIKIIDESTKTNFKQYTTDIWITTQVKSKLLGNKEVHSINYNVETINGEVYILGIAKTQQELDVVVELAENIKKVHKVIAYVRVVAKKDEAIENESDAVPENAIEENGNENKDKKELSIDSNPEVKKTKIEKVEYIDPIEDEEIIEIGQDTE